MNHPRRDFLAGIALSSVAGCLRLSDDGGSGGNGTNTKARTTRQQTTKFRARPQSTSKPAPETTATPTAEPTAIPTPEPTPEPTPVPTPEPTTDRSAEEILSDISSDKPVQIANGRVEIHEDNWRYWNFELDVVSSVDYNFTVRSGPAIDVFVTTESEYRELENGNRFEALMASKDTVQDSNEATLKVGSYYLVADNSSAGWGEPPTDFDDNVAEVEIEATKTSEL